MTSRRFKTVAQQGDSPDHGSRCCVPHGALLRDHPADGTRAQNWDSPRQFCILSLAKTPRPCSKGRGFEIARGVDESTLPRDTHAAGNSLLSAFLAPWPNAAVQAAARTRPKKNMIARLVGMEA